MGLEVALNFDEWNFPTKTPTLKSEINYDGVGEIFATVAEEAARSQCPVDTGFLLSTIDSYFGGIDATMVASAEYAQYVEYGTWKMGAREFFTPAVINGCVAAFNYAGQIYMQALQEEAEYLEEINFDATQEIDDGIEMLPQILFDTTENLVYGGSTQTVHGITFNSDGSVAAGSNGYYQINAGMWRPGTSMYEAAMYNRSHLEEYRAEAMRRFAHDNALRNSWLSGSRSMPGYNSHGWATGLGYGVGLATMGSALSAGGSFVGSLGLGMLAGGIATLFGLVLSDALDFGSGPKLVIPEIKIT